MITLAQIAAVGATDSVLAEAEEPAANVAEGVRRAHGLLGPDVDMLPVIAIVSFFAFLILVIALVLIVRLLAARRQARLIELAIQNNQPEVVRELIGKRTGFWRALLWIILFIAALSLLDKHPIFVLIVVAILLFFAIIGPERRAAVYRSAAGSAGRVQNWLSSKAQGNGEQSPKSGPDDPSSPK